jgi:hypothetical protein
MRFFPKEATVKANDVPQVQSTIRIDKELLYEAQYYLNLEDTTMTDFWRQQLCAFLKDYRAKHPERVPPIIQEAMAAGAKGEGAP